MSHHHHCHSPPICTDNNFGHQPYYNQQPGYMPPQQGYYPPQQPQTV
uniref:Rhodopsin n=1 Tax=Heterorhabditis bacteriophora TaxID=37862 RepID=A0A1I7WWG6_HETBA